jgi:hypothetical protein
LCDSHDRDIDTRGQLDNTVAVIDLAHQRRQQRHAAVEIRGDVIE